MTVPKGHRVDATGRCLAMHSCGGRCERPLSHEGNHETSTGYGTSWYCWRDRGPPAPPDLASEPADADVRAVRERLAQRAAKGLVTYGVTTERSDLSRDEWLRHLQDELLDAAVYIERIRSDQASEPDTPEEPSDGIRVR